MGILQLKMRWQWLFFVMTISSCLHHINNDFMRAEGLWEESNFNHAVILYKKAIDSGNLTNDELAASHYNIAIFYFLSLRAEDSINYINKVPDLQPYHVDALSLRAIAEDFLGRDEQALADWERLLSVNSKDSYVYYDRSFFYASRGKYDKAIEDLEIYLKLKPDDSIEQETLEDFKAKQMSQQQSEKQR